MDSSTAVFIPLSLDNNGIWPNALWLPILIGSPVVGRLYVKMNQQFFLFKEEY